MSENKEKFELDDILNEFLAEYEPGKENTLDKYIEDFPEDESELREAAAYQNMSLRIPEREYTSEEDENLTLRAASVVRNLLHPLINSATSEKKPIHETYSQINDLVEKIEKKGESVDEIAAKMRFSDIVVYVFSNREVNPKSVPREAYEAFSSTLREGVENIINYCFGPPKLQPSHYKSEGKPEFKAQIEFSDLISKDPFMSQEDKEYWLSFSPMEKE